MNSNPYPVQGMWSRFFGQWITIFIGILILSGCPTDRHSGRDAIRSIQVAPIVETGNGSSNIQIPKGLTQKYQAIATYFDNSTRDITNTVQWTSTDKTKATVTAAGIATGIAEGVVTISASQEGVTSNGSELTITTEVLQKIQITPATRSTAKGNPQQYTAIGTYSDETTRNISDSVTWNSSDISKVTVNNTGLASTLAAGQSTLQAVKNDIKSNTATLTVTDAELVSIQVTAPENTIIEGLTQKYTATGTYTDNSTQDISTSVRWHSSNTAAARVDNTGLVTGVDGATTVISVTKGNIASNNSSLTVTDAKLVSIQVTPAMPSIPKGTTVQFTATGTYDNSTTANLTNSVNWASSNTDDVVITRLGLALAENQGNATITASRDGITSGSNNRGNSSSITVTPAKLTSIQITSANRSIPKGNNEQFTAIGTYSDNSTMDITNSVSWNSSETSVSTINMAGLANGVTEGQVSISASDDGINSNSLSLSVSAAVLSSIQITPATRSIPKGNTQSYTAQGTYTDNTTSDITSSVSWSSSDTDKVTITMAGLANGANVGQATIQATQNGIRSNTASLTITPAVIRSIQITPNNQRIAKGTTQQYVAEATYSDNTVSTITNTVAWRSSNDTRVPITMAGLASGASEGQVEIQASRDGINSNTLNLTVTPEVLTAIQITPASSNVIEGLTQQFTAMGTYSDSSTRNLTSAVSWNSSDTKLATITSTGLASGISDGQVTVTARVGDITSNTATLNIVVAQLTSIQVTPATVSVAKGVTQQYQAMGRYDNNTTVDLTSRVNWHSSNTSNATITSAGLASSVAVGTSVITATLDGQTSNSANLTITAAELTAIQITPATRSLAKGNTQSYTAIGTYTDNSTRTITNMVNWSSSNTANATVTSAGLATAENVGQANIRANSGTIESNQATMTITAAELTSIQITAPTLSVPRGNNAQFTATGTYTDNTTANLTSTVSWSSTDTNRVTITPAGLANGANVGQVTISASMNGQTSNQATFTVTAAELTQIEITPTGAQSVPNGRNQQFTATGTYTDNSTMDISTTVNWTSSATNIATVSNAGLVTGASEGTANISAALSGITSNTIPLTVTAAVINSYIATINPSSLPRGNTVQMTASGTFSDGSNRNLNSETNWISSNTNIVTVSNSGLVTAVNVGQTTIRASFGGLSTIRNVTVTPAVLTSIQVSPNSPITVIDGLTQQLTATGTYSDSTTMDISGSVNWNSSATNIATVTTAGLVRGESVGQSTIRASLSGINSNEITVNVTAAQLASIQVSQTQAIIPANQSHSVTATGQLTDSSTNDVTSSATWSSSDTAVVTVNNGQISGVAAGTATITVAMGSINQTINATITPTAAVGVCGAQVNDTSKTNAATACVKVASDNTNNWFTSSPSAPALQALGFTEGTGISKNYDQTNTENGTNGPNGTFGRFTQVNSANGSGGQYQAWCDELNSISFAGKTNWSRGSRTQMRGLYNARGNMWTFAGWPTQLFYGTSELTSSNVTSQSLRTPFIVIRPRNTPIYASCISRP
ncbi:MAG: beta strand repeat-containing protein [Parashewanella sp.]